MAVMIGNAYRLAHLVTMMHWMMRGRTMTVGMRREWRDACRTHHDQGEEARTMGNAVACDARLHADIR
jgi:hypothetical protein